MQTPAEIPQVARDLVEHGKLNGTELASLVLAQHMIRGARLIAEANERTAIERANGLKQIEQPTE